MDAYVFIQTEAGRAREVMEAVVAEGKAARAAVVTGEWDVVARIDDVSWDALLDRVNEIASTDGAARTLTSASIPFADFPDVPPTIQPIKLPPPPPPENRMAFAALGLGSEADANTLTRISEHSDVMGATLLTGSIDVLVQVKGTDASAIALGVVRDIAGIPGVDSTATWLILAVTELSSSA